MLISEMGCQLWRNSCPTSWLSTCSLREAVSPQVQLKPAIYPSHLAACMLMAYRQNDSWRGSYPLCGKETKGQSIVLFVQSDTLWALRSSRPWSIKEVPPPPPFYSVLCHLPPGTSPEGWAERVCKGWKSHAQELASTGEPGEVLGSGGVRTGVVQMWKYLS